MPCYPDRGPMLAHLGAEAGFHSRGGPLRDMGERWVPTAIGMRPIFDHGGAMN